MEATERFGEVVRGPERLVALDEACLLIAAHTRPDLDIDAAQARLDDLATRVREPTLEGVAALLFGQEGFRGNVEDYYDPANSFLDQVLERRLGIPITLSVLVIEVARRIGLPLDGVGLPGHFLVRTRSQPPTFVDAFAGGLHLDVDGCAELFRRTQGPDAPFGVELLEPVGAHAIVARILGNLRAIYQQRGERENLLWVLRLRTIVPGVPLGERRILASALAASGRFDEAAAELELLATRVEETSAAKLLARASQLRARLN